MPLQSTPTCTVHAYLYEVHRRPSQGRLRVHGRVGFEEMRDVGDVDPDLDVSVGEGPERDDDSEESAI